jgi:tetratricopeptide (TPR) repeat protein
MPKRSLPAVLTLVHDALARSSYDQAFSILESAGRRTRLPAEQARLSLQLAALHALYGPAGAESGWQSLEAAARLDSRIGSEALHYALHWEFRAYQGASGRLIRRAASDFLGRHDAAAQYHMASALFTSGMLRQSLLHAEAALEGELPQHLLWRCHSLLAVLHEEMDRPELACAALELAVEFSRGADRQSERLSLAACLLGLNEPVEAIEVLNQIDEQQLVHEQDRIHRLYLLGRSESSRGNPSLALGWFSRARSSFAQLEDRAEHAEEGYQLLLAEAQLLSDLGRFGEAQRAYHEALQLAPPVLVAHGRHELAVALADAGELDAAHGELELVLHDRDYIYRAEALAELAEVQQRLGDSELAAETAMSALALRPVPAAFMCLGSIAFDYYRLDEAVSWFEQALEAAEPESDHWIVTQQLLADVFAQMGPESAGRLYQHASTALRYTDSNNDWYLPLRTHQEAATKNLQLQQRLVN